MGSEKGASDSTR